MPVMELLERNARLYPDEVALVELNPEEKDTRRTTWKEYELIQPTSFRPYRSLTVILLYFFLYLCRFFHFCNRHLL